MVSRERRPDDPILLLGGTGLRVYMFLLQSSRPVGVRELQRAFGFKSPSTARHHLERLVELGLAKKTPNGYEAVKPKGILGIYVTVLGHLLPRTVSLAVFTVVATLIYALTPGSDPAAIIVLASISLFVLWETFSLHRSLKELVNTQKK